MKNSKWFFFVLGWLGMVFYFTQRWIFGPVIPALMAEMHIDKTTVGIIGSASLWGYMLSPVAAGVLSDRFGRKKACLAGIFGFSVLTVCAGLAPGMYSLGVIRFLTGIGEAFFFIPLLALTLELFPERPGFYLALMSSGSSLGWFTGPALAGWLLEATGRWRAPFLVTGSLSLIVAGALWVFWPKQTRAAEPKPLFHPMLLEKKNYILLGILSLAVAFQIAAEFSFTMWYPAYLKLELAVNAARAGIIAGFFGLGQFFGRPSMGWLSDRTAYRPMGMAGSTALGLSIIGILIFPDPTTQALCSFIAGFIGAAAMSGLWTFTGLVFAPCKGLALGVVTTIGYLTAALAQIMIGRMGDQSSIASGLRHISVPAAFLATLALLATFLVRPALVKKP